MQHTNYLNQFIEDNFNHMNDISVDFVNEYEGQEIGYLDDRFNEYADSATPCYYCDIEKTCDSAMIDEYLDECGSVTIENSNDIDNLKIQAICYSYSRQLNEDECEIKACLYAKLMFKNPELIEKIDTSDVIQEILISLANDGHDCISFDRLSAEIADWLPDEEEE